MQLLNGQDVAYQFVKLIDILFVGHSFFSSYTCIKVISIETEKVNLRSFQISNSPFLLLIRLLYIGLVSRII